VAEEYSEFAITMRGYDRAQVDRKLEQLSRQLADARREVASLDQRATTLAGEPATTPGAAARHAAPVPSWVATTCR